MSDNTITKICTKCHEEKPLSEYSPHNQCKNGYQPACKQCNNRWHREYRKDPKVKKRYNDYCKEWHEDPKNAERKKQHRQKAIRSERFKEYMRKYVAKNKHKQNACKYVYKAIVKGRLPHPKTLMCKCGKQADMYHHHNGYDKDHCLDVTPVCYSCHYYIHKLQL